MNADLRKLKCKQQSYIENMFKKQAKLQRAYQHDVVFTPSDIWTRPQVRFFLQNSNLSSRIVKPITEKERIGKAIQQLPRTKHIGFGGVMRKPRTIWKNQGHIDEKIVKCPPIFPL